MPSFIERSIHNDQQVDIAFWLWLPISIRAKQDDPLRFKEIGNLPSNILDCRKWNAVTHWNRWYRKRNITHIFIIPQPLPLNILLHHLLQQR